MFEERWFSLAQIKQKQRLKAGQFCVKTAARLNSEITHQAAGGGTASSDTKRSRAIHVRFLLRALKTELPVCPPDQTTHC